MFLLMLIVDLLGFDDSPKADFGRKHARRDVRDSGLAIGSCAVERAPIVGRPLRHVTLVSAG